MTAYRNGVAYALGIATSVKTNTDDDRQQIAIALKANAEGTAMWRLDSVRKRKKTGKSSRNSGPGSVFGSAGDAHPRNTNGFLTPYP